MSETILLAIIDNLGGWLTTLVALVGAIAGAWSLINSRRTTKRVEAQEVATADTVHVLTKQADEATAIATDAHEKVRAMHEFMDTDTFNSAVSKITPSGRQPLEPL